MVFEGEPVSTQDLRTMREHIIYLSKRLEEQRRYSRDKTEFLQRLVDPDDFGHAVSNEVRALAYQILINESDK